MPEGDFGHPQGNICGEPEEFQWYDFVEDPGVDDGIDLQVKQSMPWILTFVIGSYSATILMA